MPRTVVMPAHLGPAGAALWKAVTADYALEPREAAILVAACESADRAAEARTLLDRDGIVIDGRLGSRAHPAVAIERDARAAAVRGLQALGADRAAGDAAAGSGSSSFPRGTRRPRAVA